MKVADIMKTPVPTLSSTMSWKQATEFFLEHRLSAAPVVDAEGKLVGVLSEKDLFRGLFPKYGEWIKHPEKYLDFEQSEQEMFQRASECTIDEIMCRSLIYADPETPVLKIGALMVARGIHQVPVVSDGIVIGMVQRGKIYMEILKKHFGLKHHYDK